MNMTYLKFNINGFSAGFEETESRVENVWVNDFCDDIVNQLHCNLLMYFFTKEYSVAVLEDYFYLYSYCEYNHRHNKTDKNSLSCVFALIALLDLCNQNKKLLQMVLVQW